MIHNSRIRMVIVLAVMFVAMIDANAFAQRGKRASTGEGRKAGLIRIRKLQGLGKRGLVRTPIYSSSVPRGAKPTQQWQQTSLTYDTSETWIDELTFQFYVLTLRSKNNKKVYSLYKKTIRYFDIAKGRSHISTVYLRPTAIKRFGDVVAIGVEISEGGKIIAEESDVSIKMPKEGKGWWRMLADNAGVEQRSGYLLSRPESPFKYVNIDDYEASR